MLGKHLPKRDRRLLIKYASQIKEAYFYTFVAKNQCTQVLASSNAMLRNLLSKNDITMLNTRHLNYSSVLFDSNEAPKGFEKYFPGNKKQPSSSPPQQQQQEQAKQSTPKPSFGATAKPSDIKNPFDFRSTSSGGGGGSSAGGNK